MADPKNNFPFQADPYTAAPPPIGFKDPLGPMLTGMLQQVMIPGAVSQSIQPQQPGVITEADAFRLNQLNQQVGQWAPAQALSMIGGGTPFAQRGGLGVAGSKPSPPDLPAAEISAWLKATPEAIPTWKTTPASPASMFEHHTPEPIEYSPEWWDQHLASFEKEFNPKPEPLGAHDFIDHLKPLDWRGETARDPTHIMTDPESAMKASELGFNIFKPLFKGGGRSEYPSVLKDPATKKGWERGFFLADDPKVAAKYGEVMPYLARAEKPHEIDWATSTGAPGYNSADMHNIVEAGHAKGADMLVIRNILDTGGKQDQFVVLNPAILRAPTAKFDYAKIKQAMPLAGIAGGAIVLNQNGEFVRYIKGRDQEHYDPDEVSGIIQRYQTDKAKKPATGDFRYKGGLTGD